jgi:hypothetical protein
MKIMSCICLTIPATAPVFSLGACGGWDDKPAITQVAVKWDLGKMAVHHVNQVLRRTNSAGVTPEAIRNLKLFAEKQALSLINKWLVAINMGVFWLKRAQP